MPPTTYSHIADDADDDLEFKLKRSIQLVKEQKMAKKKVESKERASVSRERKLALALVAIRDELNDKNVESIDAMVDANTVLFELGYDSLEGVPHRIAALNEQLKAAVEAGDGKEIARLGLELERAKAGKPPVVVKVKAAEA